MTNTPSAAPHSVPDDGMLEELLHDMLERPNLGATTIAEGFKPSKLQMLDALMAAKARQRAAEVEQVALVSGLCDAYSCLDSNPSADDQSAARILFGENLLAPSIEGVPAIAEFFGHELGPALGISPDSAWLLVWDVLALRHRHPILWEHVLCGRVEVWRARKVTALCNCLSIGAARQLDSELGPAMAGWGPVKTTKEVRAARARLDPEGEARRQEARKRRRVDLRPHEDAEGLTYLDALLDASDAHHLYATVDQLAEVLKGGGADGTIDELRASALGHLAHPDRAARMLLPDLLDGATVTDDGHIVNTETGEVVTATDKHARCRHGATIIVRLSGRDLACGGGAEIEGLGRVTYAHLQELLASCAGYVTVRPVIDLDAPMSVATYRPSAEMAWRVKERDGREMFPFSERSARSTRVDLDHSDEWEETHDTSTDNLGPTARRTHRAKTHGDFSTTQESSGRFRWRTPLGKTYWTNRHGTFTTPTPDTMTNEPSNTTTVTLATLLKAAAAEAAANRASGTGAAARVPQGPSGDPTSSEDPPPF